MAAARGPLTLRDFLELACDSSNDGFRSYPRCPPSRAGEDDAQAQLLQQPLSRLEADHLRRSPSRSPSSVFRSPGALARISSSLSRSFSRRIKDLGFVWRRRGDDDDQDLYDFHDDRDSCGFPSPLVSSCCSSAPDDSASEYDAESEADVAAVDDDKTASTSASECDKPSSSSAADHHCTDGAPGAAAADGNNKMQTGGKLGREEDNKQQLSPVSVLDFPFDDDDRSDAGTCSPSFSFPTTTPPPDLHHLLHHGRTTTTKQAQLLHKIRRYDGVAAEAVVEPVDLDARFTATSESSGESLDASTHLATTTSSSCTDTATSTSATTTTAPCHGEEHQSVERPSSPDHQHEEPDEYRLLARLLREDTAAAAAVDDDEVSQLLMLDFFAEGIDRLRSTAAAGMVVVRPVDDGDKAAEALLVGAAAKWLRGAGPQWGIRDVMLSGKAALEDMERGRRWMSVGEEERDVGAEVEELVMDGLVDELVAELVLPWWRNDGRRWIDVV